MSSLRDIILIFSFLYLNVLSFSRINPGVETPVGTIRGLTANDGDYSMFMGIPYARVREDNPFTNAIPQEPFDDVFEAYDDEVRCPSSNSATLDCLRLNIYVPNSASSSNRLPVMVWIHGGGFNSGAGGRQQFGPKFLVRHDIILVTINYRLGPYGFMCVDSPAILGNQGLKDQLLALRWVNNNIEAFGGDVNRITIFGESAGAMSVDFQLLSPYEKLFNNAILQSGTSLVQTYTAPARNAPLLMAKHLGHATDNIDDAISFLSSLDASSVVRAGSALNIDFKPCIEREFDNVDRFLPENWIKAKYPKIKDVPLLIGFNSHESLDTFLPDRAVFYDEQIDYYLRIGFDVDDDSFRGMEELVRQFYLGDEPISEKVRMEMVEFLSDFKFNHPAIRTIRNYLENDAGNVFTYMFGYSGERNLMRALHNITFDGANHADDLGYLFDVARFRDQVPNASDQLVIDRMTTMWTNFAKYSDPTPELTDIITTKWTPMTTGSQHHYLDITSELSAKTRPYHNRMTFWDLFYKINHHLQRVSGDNCCSNNN